MSLSLQRQTIKSFIMMKKIIKVVLFSIVGLVVVFGVFM